MLLPILITCVIPISVVVYQLLKLSFKNRAAHKFFEIKSPNLPVAPKPDIIIGHAGKLFLSRLNWINLDEYHRLYGPTFGWYNIGKPAVSTIDLSLIQKMVIDEANEHINKIQLDIPLKEFIEDDILTARDEQWWRIRRAVAPAFTNLSIMSPNVQDEIEKVIGEFMGSIERKLERADLVDSGREKSMRLNADDCFTRYAIALVFSCFYKQDGIVNHDSEEDLFVKIIEEGAQAATNPVMMVCCLFPILIPAAEWLIKRFHVHGLLIRKVMGFIREQTLLNLKAKQEIQRSGLRKNFDKNNFIMEDGTRFRRNMIDHIVDQFHAGKLRESEYMNSTFFLFLAATKTTGDALSRLAYQLAAHQDVQTKLRDSILRSGIESEYLHWCVHESLRLFPPVTGGCSRTIKRDIHSKAGLIPAGTLVVVPVFTVNRHKDFWGADADEFKPERWRDSKKFHPAQYLAFGAGKRNCVGKDFALNATKKLVVEMLKKYKFLPSPETNAESILRFGTPVYMFLTSDTPTYVRLCRV